MPIHRLAPVVVLLTFASACGDDDASREVPDALAVGAPVPPAVTTPVLANYEGAPRTPDVDDPAIWWPRTCHTPLVIATLKNAGLQVYDLDGQVVQTIPAFHRPAIAADDPPAPGPQPEAGTGACPDSESGETFGRFNNVDIVHGFALARDGETRTIDLAVVSDRGCDRLWIFEIDPLRPGGPLHDVTAADAPRVFPERRRSPSPLQSPDAPVVDEANPLDDQDTAYGLDAFGTGERVRVVVSQEHRQSVGLFALRGSADGRVTYERQALLHFPGVFTVPATDGGTLAWTPCRDDPGEDLQFEGLVVDEEHEVLYATQEIIGVWAVALDDGVAGVVEVGEDDLVERVRGFGAPFYAVPDGGGFVCSDELPEDGLPEGGVAGPGNPDAGGARLAADVEGATIYYAAGDAARYLLVSSQGSSSFEVYDLAADDDVPLAERHVGALHVDGVGATDGVDVSHARLGGRFDDGLLVVQSGDAPPPVSTDPVNGFAYDGAAQMVFVRWSDVAAGFDPPLDVAP